MAAGVVVSFVLLVAHIHLYWFLTDDAFISFRYARNLSAGDGLVFNPGYERVEGYTNFLWVLLLSGVDRLGWAPHLAANWLSSTAGLLTWGLVVAFCWRRGPSARYPWLTLLPALWLAVNRSFAVWSSGGLETKLFDLLVVAGVLLATTDIEAKRTSWWRAAGLMAMAALTRPDGLLIAASVFLVRGAAEWRGGWIKWREAARGLGVFVLIVGAHFGFRRLYYEEWLPNTYYAKLGGEAWWDMGAIYFEAFLLEYGAVVWLPLLSIGIWRAARSWGSTSLIAAAIVPHAVYIAYAGGDHFEYRPLDVYFPLAAVLLYDGAARVASEWRRPVLSAAWSAACCLAVALLPALTRVDFPSYYRPGYPGLPMQDGKVHDLVSLQRHPLLAAFPGMASYVSLYNQRIHALTKQFVGLRQEEHKLFLGVVEPQGKLLKQMVSDGMLPRDTFIASRCVGAIPYFSDLRILDMHGLTDKHVARLEMERKETRMMAHAKLSSLAYLEWRKVEIVSLDVGPLTNQPTVLDDWSRFARDTRARMYVSKELPGGYYLLGYIGRSPAEAQARFPALSLRPLWTE